MGGGVGGDGEEGKEEVGGKVKEVEGEDSGER